MFFVRVLFTLLVLGASSAGASALKSDVLVIGVGGNSECMGDDNGIKGLFRAYGSAANLLRRNGGQFTQEYFSWTGDPKGDTGCLTKNPDWILGGADYIRAQLDRDLVGRKIVIIGWSNGGATAYELACLLSRERQVEVSLLVTLDPASWSTSPCERGGIAARPAKVWIGVYTKSDGWMKFNSSNIIGFLGHAWNADFPASAKQRAVPLLKLEPTYHGDTLGMWSRCVLRSKAYRNWLKTEFGQLTIRHAAKTEGSPECEPATLLD